MVQLVGPVSNFKICTFMFHSILYRFASSQKDHILTQKVMTTYINMDSAIAGAMNARN
jgi:hypothetical protein